MKYWMNYKNIKTLNKMIKHEFNNISSWVAVSILKEIKFKYFITLTIDNSILLEDKDTGYFDNISSINNDCGEYLKIEKINDFYKIKSCYKNKKKEEEDGDDFKFNEILIKKENIYFSYSCLVKFLEKLKLNYKDINYVWTFEISNILYFHILLTDCNIPIKDLRIFIHKEWNSIINVYNKLSIECDEIFDILSSLNYILKLPVKFGFDKKIQDEVNVFIKFNIYKFNLYFYGLVINKKIIYDKCHVLNEFLINVVEKSEIEQKNLEYIYLESSLNYQKNTKHFFNYFGRLVKTKVYLNFLLFLKKLTKDVNNKKDVISYFIIKRIYKDDELQIMNKRIVYKFLVSIFTLFYSLSRLNVVKDKIILYSQIGKIFFYGYSKKVHDELFEKLKVLYPNFNSKQTYELLYKNTGLYFMTFFALFDFIKIKELADNKVLISFLENEEIQEFKINKKKLYGQNFPLYVKPKDWDIKIKDLNKNYTGGYLNNGDLFKIPLGKGNNRILQSNSGKVVNCINFLQSVSYEIDCMCLEYIIKNKDIIKDTNILLNIDEINDSDILKIKKQKSFNTKIEVFDKTLEILDLYKISKYFYFIYQVDFRGRIYVVSDYLNYQTNKIVRSILRYNNKQLINKKDNIINWLKVVTVRKFLGSTKESFNWFVNYFDENLENSIKNWIFNRTNENEFFWLKADEPYFFLSLLFEWYRFYTSDNYYYSGFIVFFDATCSGSQIISLLLGCDKYAESLNLVPSSVDYKIQDYYMYVVKEFLDYCEKYYCKHSFYSQLLLNFDQNSLRKFFKKVIMTINYGLTKKGMRYKFKEQLNEMNELRNWSEYNLNKFVDIFYLFLENLVLVKSLNILVDYIDFLIKNNKDFVIYTSLDGFYLKEEKSDLLIGLNYNKKDKYKYSYSLSQNKKRKRKQINLVLYNDIRDKNKEIRAFKANYVHHIDSIIVYSLINKLESSKIDISVIHDCFGIRLNDIVKFNQLYRKSLIDLFSKEDNFLNWLKYLFQKDVTDLELLNSLLKELELLQNNKNSSIINNVDKSFYIVFP